MTKVCILAAGVGSRIQTIEGLHKALLPVQNQSMLSHLFELFPKDTNFVIALGHKLKQLKTYIKNVYPKLNIEYVNVNNFSDPGSGPGLSLLSCEQKLQCPFVFMPVDNFLTETVPVEFKNNWIGTSSVELEDSKQYCIIKGEEVLESFYYGNGNQIFNGIAGIYDYKTFWESLKNTDLINGEHQVINGFIGLENVKIKRYKDFFDVGNKKSYTSTVQQFPNDLVLEKTEECLFVDNNKVVKYFSDSNKCEKRIERVSHLNNTSPHIKKINDNMYCYDFIQGEMLSNINSVKELRNFLEFYQTRLASHGFEKNTQFLNDCKNMYEQKSYTRANIYSGSSLDKINTINGFKVPQIYDILDIIDWSEIYNKATPAKFHGDLQPENIIKGKKYYFIDWRESFGESIEVGDVYYDLGKLYHGLIINGTLMLDNHFDIRYNSNEAELSFLTKSNLMNLLFELKCFCKNNNLCWQNVLLVGALNYINIAPFYMNDKNKKYSEFIFLLGKLLLSKHLVYGEKEILI